MRLSGVVPIPNPSDDEEQPDEADDSKDAEDYDSLVGRELAYLEGHESE